MPKRNTKKQVVKVIDDNFEVVEREEVGVPGLSQPGDWDILEELQGNEALRELQRDSLDESL